MLLVEDAEIRTVGDLKQLLKARNMRAFSAAGTERQLKGIQIVKAWSRVILNIKKDGVGGGLLYEFCGVLADKEGEKGGRAEGTIFSTLSSESPG